MADFPSPIDLDQQIRTFATTRNAQAGIQPGAAPSFTQQPIFTEWWKGAQQRLFGKEIAMPDDPVRSELMRGVMNLGKPMFEPTMPVPDSAAVGRPEVEFDFLRAAKHGFDESFVGSLRAWSALDGAMQFDADSSYDPFTDRRIKDSPWADQWHFFEGSRSARETDWIIGRLAEKQREGDAIDRMNGPAAPVQFVGGILGDPLSFLPLSFGAKGAWLAAKGRNLNAIEQAAFGFKPVILGGMGDGLRAVGAQAALVVGQHAIRAGVDPTYELDNMAELLALPMALAGSAGFALGSFERFSTALNVLKRKHAGDPDFMGATMPAGRAVPDSPETAMAPHGPSGVDPTDTIRAGEITGQNPVEKPVPIGGVHQPDYRGVFFLAAKDQPTLNAVDFPAGHRVIDEAGTVWEVKEGKLEGDAKKSFVTISEKPKAGGTRLEDMEFKPGELDAVDPRDQALKPGALATNYDDIRAAEVAGDGNLSAAATPASMLHNRAALLASGRMAPTGIGLEKLPIDMVARAAMMPFTSWHGTIEDLVGSGGRIRVKNQSGIPSALPVETEISRRWSRPMVETIRAQHDAWREYRQALSGGAVGQPEVSDMGRILFEARTRFGDATTKGQKPLSFEGFRRRVGDALINKDADLVTDGATQFVNKAASSMRRHYEDIKGEATAVGLFKQAHEAQVAKLAAAVNRLKKEGASADVVAGADASLKKAEKLLSDLVLHGPSLNTAPSYRPRYWLVDQLQRREGEFKDIVTDYYRLQHKMPVAEARQIADRVHEILSKQKVYTTKAQVDDLLGKVSDPMSAMARTFEIPDRLVKDFLENDAETIVRAHTRQMGTSIEMQRRFGSTGLEDEANEIMAEAKKLSGSAASAEEKAAIRKQAKLAVTDLEAARDRLYGTYGADADPHSWGNRLVRMAKQFTNLTLLGGAGMTALGDLIRPAMTEGMQAMHHYGFKTLASESRATILKMSRKELELAGDAMELMNNVRALSASDTGDLLHSRTKFERWLNQANQYFFVANGLNAINQLDKEWAGVIIQGRINDIAWRYARAETRKAGSGALSAEDMTRLAAVGIDKTMLKRIGDEIRTHGEDFKSITMANSDQWTDELARQHYGNALNQMVNRTVPTPGMGDRANWMSTTMGGLISLYKAFAAGALTRILYSGLQEGGAKFWYGAALSVGFAVMLNEIRSRLFYDRSTFDRPMTAVIADGVERSSILGWFGDVNRAVETLSGHRHGAKPWLGAERARTDSTSRQMGTLFGPAVGQGFNATDVLSDFLSNHPTAKTWANARRLVPGNTLPYLDPVFDHAISDGRWHREARSLERAR